MIYYSQQWRAAVHTAATNCVFYGSGTLLQVFSTKEEQLEDKQFVGAGPKPTTCNCRGHPLRKKENQFPFLRRGGQLIANAK